MSEKFAYKPLKAKIAEKFAISEARAAKQREKVDPELLASTLFVLPANDGEAVRSNEILFSLRAPHMHVSRQDWGASLDKEPFEPEEFRGVTGLVIFEIPGLESEERFKDSGFDIKIIDHHSYSFQDRSCEQSSIEQLTDYLGWERDAIDEMISVNDKGYIPGLKAMGLSDEVIRDVRLFDLVAQGRKESEVEKRILHAQQMIPKLEKVGEVYVLGRVPDPGILRQELAIKTEDGIVDILQVDINKIGFSGRNERADRLATFDFTTLGYTKGTFELYSVGGANGSKLVGFKPQKPPGKSTRLIPDEVSQVIRDLVLS